MDGLNITPTLVSLFSELVDGAHSHGAAFVLNSGDEGLLQSLDKLSAVDASRSVNGGATIAAHAQHVRIGLSLLNRWARERMDPYADPKWDEAWNIAAVDDAGWTEIRDGLRNEARQWRSALQAAPNVNERELAGILASIVHVGYHLGAIRQIHRSARGPREGTFRPS